MLRFLRSHISPHQLTNENIAEFIDFSKNGRHGFPSGVSCFAVDDQLSILAIGTTTGELRLYGEENVELCGSLPEHKAITRIYFVPGQAELIAVSNGSDALAADHLFYKFEIVGQTLKRTDAPVHNCLKRITCFEMMDTDGITNLLLGTVTGNVFALSPKTLELDEWVIFDNTELKNVSALKEEDKSITDIFVDKLDSQKISLVFNAAVIVSYNLQQDTVLFLFQAQQHISKVFFENDFVYCAYGDGSYEKWNMKSGKSVESRMPFGPYPCTAIEKLLVISDSTISNEIIIFSGGMPNASYGDRFTVSLISAERTVVFDFGSEVVDFLVVRDTLGQNVTPTALLVLCKEELVAIDLLDPKWRPFALPYLFPLHYAPITCLSVVDDVPEHVRNNLEEYGLKCSGQTTSRKWPIKFTFLNTTESKGRPSGTQVYLTGHEDGSVNVWAGDQQSFRRIISFNCSTLFEGYEGEQEGQLDPTASIDAAFVSDTSASDPDLTAAHDWPPFRKIGLYDMFCDDPKLSVTALCFDPKTGNIAVGGQAGQAAVFRLTSEAQIHSCVRVVFVDLVEIANEKVAGALTARSSSFIYRRGYQPVPISEDEQTLSVIVQLKPALPITAICHSQVLGKDCLTLGNEQGFAVVDVTSADILHKKFLASQTEQTAVTDPSRMSRFKSMKKSIRKSFRRKKKATQDIEAATQNEPEPEEYRPVERKIVGRSEISNAREIKVIPPSLVRVARFHKACVLSSTEPSDSLWIGTYGGIVFLFSFASLENAQLKCYLIKELKLKHGAPIIGIDGCDFHHTSRGEDSVVHRMIITTEEQIRSFSLPSLKAAKFKYKLAAIEGSRIRRTAIVRLRSLHSEHLESFFVITTNRGEFFFFFFSTTSPKQHFKVTYLKPTDIAEIISTVVSAKGDVMYALPGASQLQRASLSAHVKRSKAEKLGNP
ncbi:hypothetical protein L596_003567 [Steinernema carpocapsae]|uniref:Lethal giant larvae homologue 2 domain-containing protein n=1 Tax=Steinernema carpocapsae TaxID=34508 RepID=A0A4U8USY0_STECR|nr:hypothetical protein L596_003567 [Steinernema carpocapsae]